MKFRYTALLVLLIAAFTASACDDKNNNNPPTPSSVVLTVFHNNDGESQLVNAGEGLEDFGGLAKFATLLDNLRAEADAGEGSVNITINSGDNFIPGPEFSASIAKGVPFYDSIGLNSMDYDAMAIGNHEFDFGPDLLEQFIISFDNPPPFVTANLVFTAEPVLQALLDDGIIVRTTIIEKDGQEIGIVGLTTTELPFISSPRNVEVVTDLAGIVQTEVDAFADAGINKVILISHLQAITNEIDLAAEVTGLDIIVAGGGQELLANPDDLLVPGDELANAFGPYPVVTQLADGSDVLVVTTNGGYKYVGLLKVEFDADGVIMAVDDASGIYRVAGGDNPDAVAPNEFIQVNVVDPVVEFTSGLADNVIAASEVALEGRRSPGVRTEETNLGNLVADSLLWQARLLAGEFGVASPDVALQNGGGIRNDTLIPAGAITELTTFDILPFANFVSIVPGIPREQFKEIMENCVSVAPTADGRFAQIAGFSMVYDPAETAQVLDDDLGVVTPGTRVRSIILDNGTVIVADGAVVPGAPVGIVTNDFSARGGDQYPFRDAPFTTVGVVYQQALANYLVGPLVDGALGGVVTSAEYPEGGEGRITIVP
jgi:5'-nucleotidase